jgi:hypothetical protein
MYDDSEYAESRLINTIVRHGDTAVLVRHVDEDMEAEVRDIQTGDEYRVHLDELNLKSPPLGNVNYGRYCLYLARKPMRRDWRQGVRPHNIQIIGSAMRNPDMEAIAKCINGVFPTFEKAVQMLDEVAEVAISRDFSIRKTTRAGVYQIKYKWYGKVALVKRGEVTIQKAFLHLKDLIGELL